MSFCVIFQIHCPKEDNLENKKMILGLFRQLGVEFGEESLTAANTYHLEIQKPEVVVNKQKLYVIKGGINS